MQPRILAVLIAAALAATPAAGAAAAALELADGYRSMSLTLDSDQTAFTKAGDRIDILVTFEVLIKDERKEKVTATILQNVVVLKVIDSLSQSGKTVLLLMVNPNEAQYLALSIDGKRELRIINRKKGDKVMHPMEMASFRKLFR